MILGFASFLRPPCLRLNVFLFLKFDFKTRKVKVEFETRKVKVEFETRETKPEFKTRETKPEFKTREIKNEFHFFKSCKSCYLAKSATTLLFPLKCVHPFRIQSSE